MNGQVPSFSLHFIFFSSSRERRGRRWFVVVHNQRNVFFPFLPLNKLTAAQPMCTSVNLLYQKESLSYLFYWIIFFYYLDVASCCCCCLFCLIHQTTISYDCESIVGYRRSRNAGCLLFRQHLIVQNVVVIFFFISSGCVGGFFSCKMAQSLCLKGDVSYRKPAKWKKIFFFFFYYCQRKKIRVK